MANAEGIKSNLRRPLYEVEEAKHPYYLGPFDLFLLSIDPILQGLLFTFEIT